MSRALISSMTPFNYGESCLSASVHHRALSLSLVCSAKQVEQNKFLFMGFDNWVSSFVGSGYVRITGLCVHGSCGIKNGLHYTNTYPATPGTTGRLFPR